MRTKITIFTACLAIGVFAMPMTAVAIPGTPTSKQSQPQGSPAPSESDPGSNLTGWLKGWVTGLFGVIVGMVGLGAVAKRNVGEGLALLLVALIVGGFVIAPPEMEALTTSVWTKIAG
jgi:hypothetical protein